jgi:type II restriction enzyme
MRWVCLDLNFKTIKQMTQSNGLRNNKNQHKEKNTLSKNQEKIMMQSVNETLKYMQSKYPSYKFGWQKKLQLTSIYSKLRNFYKLSENDLYLEPVKDSTFITPDGGFIWVEIKGVKHFILIGEEKHQGTNDKRISEGKKKQALGNAVERLGKNYNGLDLLFTEEDILPFVTFLQGCDFHYSETITDRVITIFKSLKKNNINLFKDKKLRAGSYFVRGHKYTEALYGSSDWTYEEMTNVFKSISEQSLEYYIAKYL